MVMGSAGAGEAQPLLVAEREAGPGPGRGEEARVLRKIDVRLLPLLNVLYLLSFLDRANIGNAHTPMVEDLGITEPQYGLAVGVFFIGYVLLEVPSNLVLKRATPRWWLGRIVLSWGAISAGMSAVQDFGGLVACRVLLGVAEAGFFPGIVFYISFWYRPEERAQRIAAFYCSAPLAGAVGGLLAYGILRLDALGLAGWRWLFLLEGIPSILLGVFTMAYLPNFPHTARFLSPEERAIATARLCGPDSPDGGDGGSAGPGTGKGSRGGEDTAQHEAHQSAGSGFSRAEFVATVTSPVVLLFALVNFCLITPLYVCSFYMPKIIELIGFSPLASNLLTVPVFTAAAVGVLLNSRHSDRTQERILHILGPAAVGLAGFALLAVGDRLNLDAVSLTGCVLAALGSFSVGPVILCWLLATVSGHTATATATALAVGVGNLGGVSGPQVYSYFQERDDSYFWAHTIAAGHLLCLIVTVALLALLTARRRTQRHRLGKPAPLHLPLVPGGTTSPGSGSGREQRTEV